MNHLVVCEMMHRYVTKIKGNYKHIELYCNLYVYIYNTCLTFVRFYLLMGTIIFIFIARTSRHFTFYFLIDYIFS